MLSQDSVLTIHEHCKVVGIFYALTFTTFDVEGYIGIAIFRVDYFIDLHLENMTRTMITLLMACVALPISAQRTTTITPLTDQMILITIDEGYVQQPLAGEEKSGGEVIIYDLDEALASDPSQYTITSPDDPLYSVAQNPVAVYRKTRPDEFRFVCNNWQYRPFYDVVGCDNSAIDDHSATHSIYLDLPTPLMDGATYMVALSADLDTTLLDTSWTRSSDQYSEAIKVNQVGYSTAATLKYAYLMQWTGDGGSLDLSMVDGAEFTLVDVATGADVYTGAVAFRATATNPETSLNDPLSTPDQNYLGSEVYECDFSDFDAPGTYYLRVDGVGRSVEFDLSCNAMRRPFQSVMKAIYYQRSGDTLQAPYAEDLRPAPHNPLVTPGFAPRLQYSTATVCGASTDDGERSDSAYYTDGILGTIETAGWYQDAGDWDAYIRHMEVPVQLMTLYENFPENFSDDQLSLPESGNGLPDIIDEARWLPRFYHFLKAETEAKGYTSGGVPGGRIFGDLWGEDLGAEDIIRGSWQDTDRRWVVSAPDPIMTFYYAGAAAQMAYILDLLGVSDPEDIDWAAEAEDAYDWANANYNPSFSCHAYEIYWIKNYAAAALLRISPDASYAADFVSSYADAGLSTYDILQGNAAYGSFLYLRQDTLVDPAVRTDIVNRALRLGELYIDDAAAIRACRWAGNPFFPMIVGHGTTPYVYELTMHTRLLADEYPTETQEYLGYLHTTADYFLGANPLGMTWVTGLGERSPTGLLHLDAWATGDGTIKDGYVPYGPWARDPDNLVNIGPWDHHWPEQYAYPDRDLWPGHERWWSQRHAALGAEFTINQNLVNAAALYGALAGDLECTELTSTQQIDVTDTCLEVFPNPVDQYFTISGDLDLYDIMIVDASGTTVRTLNLAGNTYSIDTDLLPSGIYLLQMTHKSTQEICVQKIIKM